MKSSIKRLSVTLTLLLINTSSWAASLGPNFNTVIVFDRALDVTISAQFDTPPDDVTSCFVAEVSQGGNRFDMNRLQIDVKPTDKPLSYIVRVRSTTSVTEPWAKLVIHSTCGPKIMRTYDFLTELSSIPDSPNTETKVAMATVGISEPESAKGILHQSSNIQTTSKQHTQATKTDSPNQRKQILTYKASGIARSTKQITAKKVPIQGHLKSTKELQPNINGSPRLILESAPLLVENQISLKLTTDLPAPSKSSAAEPPKNVESMTQARAIWHTLNAKTEDLTADAMKLQHTTAQLAAQNKTNLDLRSKLQLAEQHTYSDSLVYALSALLTLALAAIAWPWLKNRKVSQAGYAWLGEGNDQQKAFVKTAAMLDATETMATNSSSKSAST